MSVDLYSADLARISSAEPVALSFGSLKLCGFSLRMGCARL